MSVLSVTRRNAGAAARAGERASLSPAGAAPAQARGNAYESGMPGHTHARTHTHTLSLPLSHTAFEFGMRCASALGEPFFHRAASCVLRIALLCSFHVLGGQIGHADTPTCACAIADANNHVLTSCVTDRCEGYGTAGSWDKRATRAATVHGGWSATGPAGS